MAAQLALQRTNMEQHARTPATRSARSPAPHALSNQMLLRRIQAKLQIGAVDDPLEREADAAADRVMRMADPAQTLSSAPPVLSRKCEACEEKDKTAQRDAADGATAEAFEAPAMVHDVLSAPGAPIDAATSRFMATRMGHDFSAVRIHTDAHADASAKAVGAHAYTVGRDVVFAAGQYQPGVDPGRRLIAHELAHVVQQRAGAPIVRREPPKKIDVSIVLSDDANDMTAGKAYAAKAIRVTSAADAAAKLKALGVPIGTLYVVSHASSEGNVQFSDASGGVSMVKVADLGKALNGAATIDNVDFRGCNLGQAPGALDSFRGSVSAQSAKGTNCWTFTQPMTPLMSGGVNITKPDQIPADQKAAFDAALIQQLAAMKAENKLPVANCIVGLKKGESAGAQNLAKIWQLYWANNGNLVANWASPEYNQKWQTGSLCMKDLTATTKPCSLVESKAPAAATP